jgi:bifunctional non-homologous end joining protein LigD
VKSKRESATVAGVPISHPDKVWWPDDALTKLDVVQYYDDAASLMLPWMKERLLTAERCPDGIRGECFYQKDFSKGLPKGIPTKAVFADSANRTIHYVIGGSKKTLLTLVNLGCIAIHVMNCRVRSQEQPDWLAFDLDPSSGEFADAARAGAVLHGILKEFKLRSFPKTSGGRGLHVFLPLRLGLTQDQVRSVAAAIGRDMAKREPRLVTVEQSKSKRRGRVFVDTLRNAFGQTVVAPYSVRHRPHAPVSVPLEWDEVDPKLDPAQYTIKTIERRLAASNPWAGFWKERQGLPELT